MFAQLLSTIFGPSRTQGKPRSPKWKTVRKQWLALHPTCAACGGVKGIECHHILPFHLFPELELSGDNFLTLCEWNRCHLVVGHSRWFGAYNPNAVDDAALMLRRVRERNESRP